MPGINRGAIAKSLFLARRMKEQVVEYAVLQRSQVDFLDRVSDAIAAVGFSMCVTRVGRLRH